MNYSIIWNVTADQDKNAKTAAFLKKELAAYNKGVQILLYLQDGVPADFAETLELPEGTALFAVTGMAGASEAEIIEDAKSRVTGDFVTEMISGDTWSDNTLPEIDRRRNQFPSQTVFQLQKIMPNGRPGNFGRDATEREAVLFFLDEKYSCFPFYFGGTFIKASLMKKTPVFPELGLDAERRFFLDLLVKQGSVVFVKCRSYYSVREREGDITYYTGLYEPDFYTKSFTDFWIPYLTELKAKKGGIPLFIQYHCMFSIDRRVTANLNNRNKHVVPEGREEEVLGLIGETLKLLDDDVIFNAHKVPDCVIGDSIKWVYGILKNGDDYRYKKQYLAGKAYYTAGRVSMNTWESLQTNINFMDYRDGILHIDGWIHPLIYAMASDVYFLTGGQKVKPVYNERYGLDKVFGVSIFRNHSFHIEIPLENVKDIHIFCMAEIEGEKIKIRLKYESHFSRMSGRFANSYWWFGKETPFLMTKNEDGLRLRRMNKETEKKDHKEREKMLLKEMFRYKRDRRRAWIFILIRLAYWFMRPRIKTKPIWMYLDKIYKGGDSSEYLFRYASAQKEDIKHYYLIDKKSTDYKRLKKDGYKPLIRGSIMHRLIFLMSDMMVISNSTVYAFNNFGMVNSSYIRDLPDFHVCCVQHGMSVQKIAVAQQRLRDNTRLYFCASKYEIKNLSHPVYDYLGYEALKLTGVPRYDGLVNDDKKQIMISPTWRMQAAAPVRTSEGEQRDYNPLFKESAYFKVFNSLINDERLIAAAKQYGYRIKYVLHPIVSSQVRDFDRNDYVDIVPAVGDMSYERMFCESSLMVTDYSGIQFDFAYMRKPLVYLHHRDIPQHYEEGSFFYDTMAFGEICHDNDELIDLLTEYMAGGCRMKPEFVARADDFFYYNDHNNCERIYRIMLAYQRKYIFPEKAAAENEKYIGEHAFVPDTGFVHADLMPAEGETEKIQGAFDLGERQKMLPAVDEMIDENGYEPEKASVEDFYYDLPVKENTVLLLGLGHNVRGNMQYILNELNHSPDFEGFKVYVRTNKDTDEIVKGYISRNGWKRTKTLPKSGSYDKMLSSAQYLITESYFSDGWTKKPGQVVINVWHGTPLKKLGLAKNFKNLHKDGGTQRNFIDTDYLIYPNEYTREHMLESYKVEELLCGQTGLIGYARTGGMMAAANRDLTELKKRLAPAGEKIYAYMPTWKDYLEEKEVIAETKELLDYLDSVMRDDQVLYSNLHHKITAALDYSGYKHIHAFPPDVDSYELLAATEALITDYSSVFYDYLAIRKQIILYCADYELYEKRRGTYMDLMSLPFDKARTKEEVYEAMNRGKTYDDTDAFNEFCSHDSVDNAARLTGLISGNEEVTAGLTRVDAEGKRKVLIYSTAFAKTAATDMLYRIAGEYDRGRNRIWFSGDMNVIDDYKENAYPLLRNDAVIGARQDPHLSGRGKTMLSMYKEGVITLEQAMEYLKYDYALVTYRAYGHAQFDLVVLYDVQDPEWLLIMSSMDADRMLVITEEMMQEIRLGNTFMADALVYAAGRCRTVYVCGEQNAIEVKALLPAIKDPVIIYEIGQLMQMFV